MSVSVNKNVTESQTVMARRKKMDFPSSSDNKKLHDYLKNKRIELMKKLTKKYTKDDWFSLMEVTLMSIKLFNRRRAGEVERILIEDYDCNESIQKIFLKGLSHSAQQN